MALPKLTKRRTIWAKIETVYGNDSNPTIDNAVLVNDLDVRFDADIIDRDNIALPDLSKCKHLIGRYYVTLTCSCDLRGSGTGGEEPDFDPLLLACSMAKTVGGSYVTYAPTSSDQQSVTIYANIDGLLHKIVGCVGTYRIRGELGQPARIEFDLRGKLKENPTDSAFTTGATCTLAPPVLLGANISYGGWTPVIAAFELDIANSLTERRDITEESGIQGFFVSDRKPVVSIDPEAVSVATRNIWDNFRDLNEAQLSLSWGTVAGNKIAINAPKCVKRAIPYGDRDGILTYQIQASLIRTSGDDEFTVKFE